MAELKRMGFAEYLRAPGVNFSTLKHFAKTPAHAQEAMLHPEPPTPAQELGTAIHAAVLEPEWYAEAYAVAPVCDRRTKEGKALWSRFEGENPGATVLKAADAEVIEGMRESIIQHPFASELLASTKHTEVAIFWDADVDGVAVPCKARLDLISVVGGWTWVGDLKTVGDGITDASPEGFSRAVAGRYYHAQAAMYLDGLQALSPHLRRFTWIAVEKDRPYCVACHEPDDQMLEVGRLLYTGWLASYVHCQKTNQWPGYASEPGYIALPAWAQMGTNR